MELPVLYDGLTPVGKRYVREQYIREQEGRCYHCGALLEDNPARDKKVNPKLFPPGFFSNPIHLHHSHESGMTIGAVHAYCNAILWQYHGE